MNEQLALLQPETSPRNDIGNGKLFADYYKFEVKYVIERKCWAIYNGRLWVFDISVQMVMWLCKKLSAELAAYAAEIGDMDYSKYVAQTWVSRSKRETIIKDAASECLISMADFDKDPFLLNVQNGTLDLASGVLRHHSPGDFLTKMSNVSFEKQARCLLWEKSIDEIMEGDAEKIKFLQKMFGYALTGDTKHEVCFFSYGPSSRNGKSLTHETVSHMLGDYAKSARPETLAGKRYGSGGSPNEDIARLVGSRMVIVPEPDKGMILSAALLKALTGNDKNVARFLHENSFEFNTQYKIFLTANHLPIVSDPTLFLSGRILVIPFTRHFSEDEQNKFLKHELLRPENLSGILNWCVEGLRMLNDQGFIIPESVIAATAEYRHDSDKAGRFVDEMLVEDEGSEIRTGELYSAYQDWCRRNGHYAENANNFKDMLANYGRIERRRPRDGGEKTTLFFGYSLSPY